MKLVNSIGVFFAYAILAKFSLSLAVINGNVTPIWPPSGLALAFLYFLGNRYWPTIFLAATVVTVSNGTPLEISILIGIGNTVQSVLAVYLLSKWIRGKLLFSSIENVVAFLSVSVFVSLLASAFGTSALFIGGMVPLVQFIDVFYVWMIGDLLGIILFAPFLISWGEKKHSPITTQKVIELVIVFTGLIIACVYTFGVMQSHRYIVFIFLMWLAIRFTTRTVTLGTLTVSLFAFFYTLQGMGPFAGSNASRQENLIFAQLYLGVAQIMSLILSSVITTQKETQRKLLRSKKRLDKIVKKRTQNLLDTNKKLQKVNKQLAEVQSQFMALYEANIVGVIYADLSGSIFDSNDAFLDILGYSREDLVDGKIRWDKLTPPEYAAADEKAVKQLLKTGKVKPYEKAYLHKKGHVVPVIVGAALINKETTETMAFVLDITERKMVEQRKDEFIGIASHELKTPLTSIKGYTQIMQKLLQQLGDEKLKTYIDKTNIYIDRLNSLISELLDVSKIQSGKLQLDMSKFYFDDLVREAKDSMKYVSSKHTILLEGEADALVYGDKHRLEQVFNNLLSNAIKYSPKADRVFIRVRKTNKEVVVAIQDFGVGIPQTKIPKLFGRFYRVEETAQQFSGLGIGLYIAAEIVHRHQGRIWVESKEGKGSTFYFTLPRYEKKKELKKRKVLICDDDQGIVDVMCIILGKKGYDLVCITESEKIFDTIEVEQPHLIIIDLWMPQLSGEQIVKTLKKDPVRKTIPIIVVSASRETEKIAIQSGADAYLCKPFDITELEQLVDHHIVTSA